MIMHNTDTGGIVDPMTLPCGGKAYFDFGSGISYRCRTCQAIVGSSSMSEECKTALEKTQVWEVLGGPAWNYTKDSTK